MHVRIGCLSNYCSSHILSFVIFVELFLVEVEIVKGGSGRLSGATVKGVSQDVP